MNSYADLNLLFGDIHNHCGISYAHGSLEDALSNARERLDFVSVTGHAHWPDMPEPNDDIQYIIDFHEEGFAKLKAGWPEMMETLKQFNDEGNFVVFPGFEVHFSSCGDRNMLYKNLEGEILYPKNLENLHNQLRTLREQGRDTIAQPHHLGYLKGTRGIDWNSFSSEFAPFVEMLSMHGCSESSENIKPFLHSMGPSDWQSTIHYGLKQGHVFGFSGVPIIIVRSRQLRAWNDWALGGVRRSRRCLGRIVEASHVRFDRRPNGFAVRGERNADGVGDYGL